MSDKFKQVPLNVALIQKEGLNNGYDLIRNLLTNTPFYLTQHELDSQLYGEVDVILLCDLDASPPLYYSTYLRNFYPSTALIVIGPTLDGSASLMHVIAGAQDYFNCQRLVDSPDGFIRCIRFSYEREKRWKEKN